MITSLERRICSSFPPLDPNGQPLSMLLRGIAASLGDLRCTTSSIPNLRHQLVEQLQKKKMLEVDGEDKFEDVDVDLERQANQNQDVVNNELVDADTHNMLGEDRDSIEETENKKRSRGDEEKEDDENEESDDEIENIEHILFYMPSVACTCSSWKMKEVQGDLFITPLRVLFLPEKQGNNGEGDQWDENDIAIDGRFIALHAVDSLPSAADDNDEADVSHHVYCQLAEATGDNENMGYTSAISMVAPTIITEENNDDDGNDDIVDEEDASLEEDDSTLEVYFKPTISDKGEKDGSESQCNKCQSIFDSLTKLITLNPAGDSDEGFGGGGGGLFNMLSLMAGIGNGENGFDGDGEMVVANHENDEESDDDMIIRLGGSNNLVENDNESDGADDDERQAMLRRLDDMLVVPPEYEIPSEEDNGQFSDAEEEEEDDAIL